MLRLVSRALAACASIAAITLLAPTASAELPMHPRLQIVGPDLSDIGPNLENPNEPAFGMTVVIRNEEAFVGMPFHPDGGRVAVFTATPTALSRKDTLTASDAVPGARFGRSLAFRDSILVVGDDKAAYVFQRSNGVWTQRQKLMAPATDDVRSFADSLRYEDGTLAIGANTPGGFDRPGAVYIYERNAAGKFIARGKLVSTDSSPNDGFGSAISTAGPVMVVGAPGSGAAYIFRRTSTGVWRQHQTLVAIELGRAGGFGATVAIDRQMIIVGAPGVGGDDPSAPWDRSGAAYGFTPGGGVYVETFKLEPQPDDIDQFHSFGHMIAMFDERIVVAARHDRSSDSQLDGFLAFTYTRAGSSVMARGIARGDLFSTNFSAQSLSLANQRLLMGVPCTSTFPGFCTGSGRVELYKLNVLQ